MRAVSQVLELALSLLDQNPCNRVYMCCHLDWMNIQGFITSEESNTAQSIIRRAINYNTTLCQYLRETGAIPKGIGVHSPEYAHYQLTFYRGLISKLQTKE